MKKVVEDSEIFELLRIRNFQIKECIERMENSDNTEININYMKLCFAAVYDIQEELILRVEKYSELGKLNSKMLNLLTKQAFGSDIE